MWFILQAYRARVIYGVDISIAIEIRYIYNESTLNYNSHNAVS